MNQTHTSTHEHIESERGTLDKLCKGSKDEKLRWKKSQFGRKEGNRNDDAR